MFTHVFIAINRNFQTFDYREPFENTISTDAPLSKLLKKKCTSKESEINKLKQQVQKLKTKNKKWKNQYFSLKSEYKRMVSHIDNYLFYQQNS